jgi:hypothetical protein
MYLIREQQDRSLLTLELSGHVTTDEAVSMVNIVAEMVRTDSIRAVRCDIYALEFGPDRPAAVAATLAALVSPGLRIAVMALEPQMRSIRRIFGLACLSDARAFASPGEAENWLAEVVGHRTQLPATAKRHAEELLGAAPAPDPSSAPARRVTAA